MGVPPRRIELVSAQLDLVDSLTAGDPTGEDAEGVVMTWSLPGVVRPKMEWKAPSGSPDPLPSGGSHTAACQLLLG